MLNVNQYHQRHVERERYRRSVTKGWLWDSWGRITGRATDLVRFEEVAQRLQLRQQLPRGLLAVRLDQIVGSVGRAEDFTRSFLPRGCVDGERWVQIATMFTDMETLPPVELYQVGAVYFVRDGHHRISVARVNNLREVEANVVEFTSPVLLKTEHFQQKQWQRVIEQTIKEKTMFVIDAELAKHEFEERLRQGERERYARQILANRPSLSIRLQGKLADFLIAFGTWLKAQPPQQELVT
ncbi:MAG: hypothetical protein U0350_08460 [Caldilineaceae bacterium]